MGSHEGDEAVMVHEQAHTVGFIKLLEACLASLGCRAALSLRVVSCE